MNYGRILSRRRRSVTCHVTRVRRLIRDKPLEHASPARAARGLTLPTRRQMARPRHTLQGRPRLIITVGTAPRSTAGRHAVQSIIACRARLCRKAKRTQRRGNSRACRVPHARASVVRPRVRALRPSQSLLSMQSRPPPAPPPDAANYQAVPRPVTCHRRVCSVLEPSWRSMCRSFLFLCASVSCRVMTPGALVVPGKAPNEVSKQ